MIPPLKPSWARHHTFKLNVCSFKYSPQPNAALLLGIKYIVVGEKKTYGLVDQPIVFVFIWSSIKVAPEHIFKTSLHRRCPLLLCRVWMKCSYNKESFFRPISFSTQTTENTKLESDGCEKGGGEGLGLEFSKTKKNKPKHNIYICQVLRLRSAGGQMPGLLGLFSLHIFKNIFGFKKMIFQNFSDLQDIFGFLWNLWLF